MMIMCIEIKIGLSNLKKLKSKSFLGFFLEFYLCAQKILREAFQDHYSFNDLKC
jgi:uncharacterized membrane protein